MNAKIRAILKVLSEAPAGEKIPLQDGKPRTNYAHTYGYYAELYKKDLSTIKRWAKEGKPLDDAKLMEEHISPRGRKPGFQDDGEPGADPEGGGGDIAFDDGVGSPVTLDKSFFAGSGVLSAIERLQKAERERAGAYFRAISTRQATALVQNRFKEWMGIIEALRKMEEAAPEIRKLNELTVDVAEMDAAIGHVFAAFRTATRNLPGRAAGKLVGLRDRDEIFAVLEREMEVLLRTLTEITVGAVARAEQFEQRAAEAADGEETEAIEPTSAPPIGAGVFVDGRPVLGEPEQASTATPPPTKTVKPVRKKRQRKARKR